MGDNAHATGSAKGPETGHLHAKFAFDMGIYKL
jgi:hypothetical protein